MSSILYDQPGTTYDDARYDWDGQFLSPQVTQRPLYWIGGSTSGDKPKKPRDFTSIAIDSRVLSVNGYELDDSSILTDQIRQGWEEDEKGGDEVVQATLSNIQDYPYDELEDPKNLEVLASPRISKESLSTGSDLDVQAQIISETGLQDMVLSCYPIAKSEEDRIITIEAVVVPSDEPDEEAEDEG